MVNVVLISAVLALLSYVLVDVVRRWAKRHSLDIPNERSSHTTPTPRGGGLAIVVVVLGGWLIYGVFDQLTWQILPYVLGAGIIAFVGWLDDLRGLPASLRLSVQFASAAIAIVGFGYWKQVSLPFIGPIELSWFGVLLTFCWIVGLTNAYNFMDGIDGIAGGQAAIAGLGWFLIALALDEPRIELMQVMGLLLFASNLGFLGHNWSPASIFMGDVGSSFLGYTFAIIPLIPVHDQAAVGSVLLLWPFIFDTFYTFLARLLKRENVFKPHRSHLYQKLVIAGYSHRVVSLLYIVLAGIGFVLSAIWYTDIDWVKVSVIFLTGLLCVALKLFVRHQEQHHAPTEKSVVQVEKSLRQGKLIPPL